MGKIATFLQETFRSPTPEEEQAIRRYQRQRMVTALIAALVMLLALGCFLLPKAAVHHRLAGTWVAEADYADGFHPGDAYLEFRDGAFYRNGSLYGPLKSRDGRQVIPVQSPLGQYDRYLSQQDDRLQIEYTPPQVATVYSGSSYFMGGTGLTGERVVDVYIRISTDCGLTEAQREQLY